jgi:hypothetical protein
MDRTDSSIHHKNNNLKVIIAFANFLSSDFAFHEVKKQEQVLAFLNIKVKDSDSDPEKDGLPLGIIISIESDSFSGGFVIAGVKPQMITKLVSQTGRPLSLLK